MIQISPERAHDLLNKHVIQVTEIHSFIQILDYISKYFLLGAARAGRFSEDDARDYFTFLDSFKGLLKDLEDIEQQQEKE